MLNYKHTKCLQEMGARDRPEDGDLVILVTGHSNLQCTYLEVRE